MASSNLHKLSVPVAGETKGNNTTLLMPKLNYRFRVQFTNFGTETSAELTRQIIKAGRPKVSFEDINLKVYNSTIKLAGRHTWDNITVEIRDDATGAIQKQVGSQLQKQLDFFEQASAVSGQDYKFTMLVEMLDGGNGSIDYKVLEAWTMFGCYVKSADYQPLDYGATSDAMKIILEIAFDSAIQDPTGVGTTKVPRTSGTTATA